MSKFTIVNQRYIAKDNKLVCTVMSPAYSNPMLETLREIESSKNDEYSLKVLQAMISKSKISQDIRKPTPADEYVFNSFAKPTALPSKSTTKEGIGQKYICSKCSAKFYDLNGRVNACPSCQTPIKEITC